MFESIKHTGSSDGMTTACYVDGDVAGQVFFASHARRVVIISDIGTVDHARECLAIYRTHGRPIVKDEINCYA